jgi:hypothetical protein
LSFFNREFSRERELRATEEKIGEHHHCYSYGGAMALYVEGDDDDDDEEEDSIARRRLSFFNGGFSIERESKSSSRKDWRTPPSLLLWWSNGSLCWRRRGRRRLHCCIKIPLIPILVPQKQRHSCIQFLSPFARFTALLVLDTY